MPLAGIIKSIVVVVSLFFSVTIASAENVTLNLNNSDINAVITTVSKITGRNVLVDPRVKGKVTIISAHPMEKKELYEVFLSILEVHGYAAIDDGKVVKIIPNTLAKQRAIPIAGEGDENIGDQMVTQIIAIKNVQVQKLSTLLKPLMSQESHIAPYTASNILIISDRASNIERLTKIIDRIDQVSEDDIEVITLQNASASDVVRVVNSLNRLQTKEAKLTRSVNVIADERTNSILVSGDKASKIRIRTIIAHLDTPLETGGNTQVVYLKYAEAEELVRVLLGIAKNQAKNEPKQPLRKNNFDIQAHEATNSLIITAPPEQMRNMKSIVRQLDIRRAQVLVEAVIAEVRDDVAKELGIQFRSTNNDPGGKGAIGGSFFRGGTASGSGSIDDVAQNPLGALGGGLNLGFFDGTQTILGVEVLNIGVMVRALSGDTTTNIIATPSLITLDNEEAEIVVAQNVPFVTGSFTNTGTAGSSVDPFQTIQREDVGVILRIKPQINEGNAVRLDIEQEVSQVSPSNVAVDLITTKRNIKTTVMAGDKQMIVLGGLIDDTLVQNVEKVPVLGDIPLIGGLFRSKSTSKEKRNLMVFLQPTIVRDAATTRSVTHGKYDFVREKQLGKREQGVFMMDDSTTPVLVPRDKAFTVPSFSESDLLPDEKEAPVDSTAQDESLDKDIPVDSTAQDESFDF
jgi:general secretion pathway protein D